MEGFQPVRNDRLSDRAVHQLVQRIRAGELPVGTRLPNESQLANQLGVSRGILREALTVLQTQGYITRTPGEGTIVRRCYGNEMTALLSSQIRNIGFQNLVEMRELVECRAVQNVINLASDTQIDELFKLIQADIPANSSHRPDYYFHYQLAELSGNHLFTTFVDVYYDVIREKELFQERNQKQIARFLEEHIRIAKAIQSRNAKAAVSAMRTHLRHVHQTIQKNA